MADRLSTIGEAIKQAVQAYVETIVTLSEAVQNSAGRATPGTERGLLVDNWLRLGRMGKDSTVAVIEQGFELWEREMRRLAATGGGAAATPSNPLEAWAENWRNAMQTFTGGGLNQEFRKQAEAVQKTLTNGMRAWQSLWEREKK